MNLTLGVALFLFYAYFVLVQPLLGWLGPTGYMMLAPALVSGILGIGIKKFGWHQK